MAKIQKERSVCLITPGHLASDPRLIKEAKALSDANFKVHLVFTQYMIYLVEYDQIILNRNPEWTYEVLDWTGDSFGSKVNRLSSKLFEFLRGNNKIQLNRNHNWLLKKASAHICDLYIAHNLGALPIAVHAAKKNNTKCGFDAEDFHRFETSDNINSASVKHKIAIENHYIPQLDHFTASSPLIALEYSKLYNRSITCILNTFPRVLECNVVGNTNNPLQLFWFSQTVGANRGIETIISGIGKSQTRIELHLLGDTSKEYKESLESLITTDAPLCKVRFHKPVQADRIFELACQYDIGLAAETPFPLNRNICLTNKLFTYIQSGLAVIASATTAQKGFFNQFPKAGILYRNDDEFADALKVYQTNRVLLLQTKEHNYLTGQNSLNWEIEKTKFLDAIFNALNCPPLAPLLKTGLKV